MKTILAIVIIALLLIIFIYCLILLFKKIENQNHNRTKCQNCEEGNLFIMLKEDGYLGYKCNNPTCPTNAN